MSGSQGFIQKGGEPWDIHPQTSDLPPPPPQTPEEIFEISSDFNLVLLKKATLQLLPTPPCPLSPTLSGKSCMNPWGAPFKILPQQQFIIMSMELFRPKCYGATEVLGEREGGKEEEGKAYRASYMWKGP